MKRINLSLIQDKRIIFFQQKREYYLLKQIKKSPANFNPTGKIIHIFIQLNEN